MTKSDRKELLAAEKRIRAYDAIDAKHAGNFPVPLFVQLVNIDAALTTGLQSKRWDCVADAIVMLRQCSDPAIVDLGRK